MNTKCQEMDELPSWDWGLNYGQSEGGQRDDRASALSCHCSATPPPRSPCRSVTSALPSSRALFPWSQAVPLLRSPFLSSQGFLCIFLLKVKGNNKAGAALQPPPDFAAPSTRAQSPASALPGKATLPGIFPVDFSQLKGFPLSGGGCWKERTFGPSSLSSEGLLGTFGFQQRIATTRASIKSLKPTQRNHVKRLILSFPVLRQRSLSLVFYRSFYTWWVAGKWVEDVEILLQKHLPAPFLSPESNTQNILLFS